MIKNLGSSSNPRWFVRVSVRRPNGQGWVQKQRKGIRNKAVAERAERDLYGEAKSLAQQGINPTWENIVQAYLADAEGKRDLSRNTTENYKANLNAYSVRVWSGRKIDTIQKKDVLELLDNCLADRSISHQKYNVKCISAVFRYALDRGLCHRNPCEGIRFKVPQPDLNIWNAEQASRFLTAAKNSGCKWYEIWAFALHTGMRNGELYALQWKHIDLEKNVIKVAQAWTSKTGIKSTKNRQIRMVPINSALEGLVKEMKLRLGGNFDDFVLPRFKEWTKGEQARELRMFIMGMGLPRIRFHDLRATFASQLLLSGAPMHVVQAICGWSDLKTAQRYLRLSGMEIIGATNNLGYGVPTGKDAQVLPILSSIS